MSVSCRLSTILGVLLLACSNIYLSNSCAELSGIGYGPNDFYTPEELSSFPIYPNGALFEIIFAAFSGIPTTETAIKIYFAAKDSIIQYNTLAAFENNALDFFGREDITLQRRRCDAYNSTIYNSYLYKLHYKIAHVYAWYYSLLFIGLFDDSSVPRLAASMRLKNLDPDICNDTSIYNCSNDINTPWGLAYTIAEETVNHFIYNGWNVDGSYNRDINPIRFEDWRDDNTRYIPENNPWILSKLNKWQPLLENDGRGFLFHQEHNVPHIGYTGKSFFYTDNELCQRKSYDPFYNYTFEIELLFDRLSSLTDELKMEIEFFDNKIASLTIFSIFYAISIGRDWDTLDGALPNIIESISNYESLLAVWKEKIDFDRVRPTSIVHELYGDEIITTYGGTNFNGETLGIRSYLGKNFQPYIRTMPHAEYPSSSSCLCKAYAEGKIIEFGNDTLEIPLTASFNAFSSEYEPGSTPANDITLLYNKWSEISQRCRDSRIQGGMHFTESIYAGELLCADIGKKVAINILNLRNGIKPDYIIDINDNEIRERKCYPNKNKCTLPRQCNNSPCLEDEVNDNCKIYTNGIGCEECINGYYLYTYDYPCIPCTMSCKNCKECENFHGCIQCKSKNMFNLLKDNETNLDYCQPKEKDEEEESSSSSSSYSSGSQSQSQSQSRSDSSSS